MGSYRNEDEALIGLARQLTDAYGEARTREDQDYACDSIAEFLSEYRASAPSEALLAILDLPLTAETYPLVDEAQIALAVARPRRRRAAARGGARRRLRPGRAGARARRRDARPDGPGRGRRSASSRCCAAAATTLKGAAVDGLVALGRLAEPDLVASARRPGRRRLGTSGARADPLRGRAPRGARGLRRRRGTRHRRRDDASRADARSRRTDDEDAPRPPRDEPRSAATPPDARMTRRRGRRMTTGAAGRPKSLPSRSVRLAPAAGPAGRSRPARPGPGRRRLRRLPSPVRAGGGRRALLVLTCPTSSEHRLHIHLRDCAQAKNGCDGCPPDRHRDRLSYGAPPPSRTRQPGRAFLLAPGCRWPLWAAASAWRSPRPIPLSGAGRGRPHHVRGSTRATAVAPAGPAREPLSSRDQPPGRAQPCLR